MRLRSLLFVPADSERKLARAGSCGADAVIVDLEDAVAGERKAAARAMAAEYLGSRPGPTWVRINPVETPLALADLTEVVRARPDGIMLPKATPAACARLACWLDALEAAAGIDGAIPILPVATETPAAVLALGGYAQAGLARLAGLTWGAEDLAAEIGADGNRGADGAWRPAFATVRVAALMAAKAAGVLAIETLEADLRDLDALARSSAAARAEGFDGRLAIHPDQVSVINAAFTPSADEVARARLVVDAFAAAGGAGTVALDGRMLDRPHLRAALRVVGE